MGPAAPSSFREAQPSPGCPRAGTFPSQPLPALVALSGTEKLSLRQALGPGARGTIFGRPYKPACGIPVESGVPPHSPQSSFHHPLQIHLQIASPLYQQQNPAILSHPKEGNQAVLSVLLTPAKGLQSAFSSSWPPQPCLASFAHFPPLLWQGTNEKILYLCLCELSVCSL